MKRLFEKNRQLRKDVLSLALPVIAEQTFITLMGMVNAMMAGHISKEAAAAIGMVDSLNNIFINIFSALAVGGTVVVAHYIGQNNSVKAGETSKQALYAGLGLASLVAIGAGIFRQPLLGFLYGSADARVLESAYAYLSITLFTYPLIALTSVANGVLRGAGDTKNPAKVVIIMNIINIIASYILIFGISFLGIKFNGFGVHGAALGIAIARITGAMILIYILMRGTLSLQVERIHQYKPNFELLSSIFKIGIPASIESVLFSAGKLFTQTFIVPMGTIAIVSNYIGMSIHSMLTIPGMAMSIAATALVGQNMGRGDSAEAKKALMYLSKLGFFCLMTLCIISLPFFGLIARLYTPNQEIIKLSAKLLSALILFMPFWPFAFLAPAGLKGAGDVKYTLVASAISMWLFRITLGYVLGVTFKLGLWGVWYGMFADWVIRGIFFYLRLQGTRWSQHVVIKRAA